MSKRKIIAAAFMLALLATAAIAQPATVEVIPLKYRTAEQVIPVLKPLLDRSGSMSGMQNQLIVRTSAANLADIKQVLATLDAAPRQLMISVRQDTAFDRDHARAELSGRASTGNASAAIPGGNNARGGVVEVQRGDDVLRGRVDSTRSTEGGNSVQSIRVLEGSSAFITSGQSVPMQQRQTVRTVVNGQIIERTASAVEYRDVVAGFYVVPRLSGDRVTLEISSQRDTLAAPQQHLPRGSVNVQQATTTVSGRLGEWLEIGGIRQTASDQQSTMVGSSRDVSSDNRQTLLKVDEIR
ncbi:MAG: type secretory pathway, component PulD [Betaproteobacteria bacterium]|nr:type secretory pathway, component PulD [Betaproteobacteria bacterium]